MPCSRPRPPRWRRCGPRCWSLDAPDGRAALAMAAGPSGRWGSRLSGSLVFVLGLRSGWPTPADRWAEGWRPCARADSRPAATIFASAGQAWWRPSGVLILPAADVVRRGARARAGRNSSRSRPARPGHGSICSRTSGCTTGHQRWRVPRRPASPACSAGGVSASASRGRTGAQLQAGRRPRFPSCFSFGCLANCVV